MSIDVCKRKHEEIVGMVIMPMVQAVAGVIPLPTALPQESS
ncbi:hypothetical protein [Nitrospira sp. M1]